MKVCGTQMQITCKNTKNYIGSLFPLYVVHILRGIQTIKGIWGTAVYDFRN